MEYYPKEHGSLRKPTENTLPQYRKYRKPAPYFDHHSYLAVALVFEFGIMVQAIDKPRAGRGIEATKSAVDVPPSPPAAFIGCVGKKMIKAVAFYFKVDDESDSPFTSDAEPSSDTVH